MDGREEKYNGCIIKSTPFTLEKGGFSSNGVIERYTGDHVDHLTQAVPTMEFNTQEEAHDYFIREAKKIIDEGRI